MEHNTSSCELMFVLQGSEREGYELIPIFPTASNDGDSLLGAFTQDPNPLLGEDGLEDFEPGSWDLSDLLDAFPAPPRELPVPFSQEPRHPTSCQYQFSEPMFAEICTAELIRLIVRHPIRRSVDHCTRVLRGFLGTPSWGRPKLQRRVFSSRNAPTGRLRPGARAFHHRSIRRKVSAFRKKHGHRRIVWSPS